MGRSRRQTTPTNEGYNGLTGSLIPKPKIVDGMEDKPRMGLEGNDRTWARFFLEQASLMLDVAAKFPDDERRSKAYRHASGLVDRSIKTLKSHPLD